MGIRIKAAVAAVVVGAVTLAGCGQTTAASSSGDSGSGNSGNNVISLAGFSVLGKANVPVIKAFQATPQGKGVTFQTSYGASGDESRAVLAGQKADLVHLSLASDVTRLSTAKPPIVSPNWDKTPTQGIATSSVVVIVVRKGNPKHITGWDDLVKPGIKIVTPDPGSSGSARWNILAAWAHISGAGGSQAQAKAFVTKFLDNTVALPGSSSQATTAFVNGTGDALISYEDEAIEAKQAGDPVDYIVPSDTLRIDNPAAVTVNANPKAKDFLNFMLSTKGQQLYAQGGFRPVISGVNVGTVKGANDPSNPFPQPKTLYTIDKNFGGWGVAGNKYFGDGQNGDPLGIITQIQQSTGKVGSN